MYLCTRNREKVAQMAESVDALVSNTSGFTSIPVRPRVWVQEKGVVVSTAPFFMPTGDTDYFLERRDAEAQSFLFKV